MLAADPGLTQEEEAAVSDAVDANNPLANFTAFNVQNYYIPELTGSSDPTANNFWLRYAQPIGNWLFRASLPVSNVPTSPVTSESGIGDLNAFFAYFIDVNKPGVTFGIGP